jgi:hypothetical protein
MCGTPTPQGPCVRVCPTADGCVDATHRRWRADRCRGVQEDDFWCTLAALKTGTCAEHGKGARLVASDDVIAVRDAVRG